MARRLQDHEPVTVQLPTEHVAKLKRRALEQSTFRQSRSHADLIRYAVRLYVESFEPAAVASSPAKAKALPAKAAKKAGRR